MNNLNVKLSSINDVKDFINIVDRYKTDIYLSSGKYMVDAKSVIGIFSLDLSKPLKVKIDTVNYSRFFMDTKRFHI